MFVPDAIVSVAIPEDSIDHLWFVKVLKVDCVELDDVFDTYRNRIPASLTFLKGQFLEKHKVTSITLHTTYHMVSHFLRVWNFSLCCEMCTKNS